jgi:dihydrofolate reductase
MKNDMQRVKDLTTDNAIIMGRNTFDSIGRALPNRQNIVMTHRPFTVEGVDVVSSLSEAYSTADTNKDVYIFGGQQIYQLALDTVDRIYATEIHTTIDEADAFFPELSERWHEVSRDRFSADENNVYAFDFVTYEKSRA